MARVLHLALLLALPALSSASQQPAPEALFLAAVDDALAPVAPDPTFASHALVAVRSELLSGVALDAQHPLRLALDLEAGVREVARFEQRTALASGALAFSGVLENASQSQ